MCSSSDTTRFMGTKAVVYKHLQECWDDVRDGKSLVRESTPVDFCYSTLNQTWSFKQTHFICTLARTVILGFPTRHWITYKSLSNDQHLILNPNLQQKLMKWNTCVQMVQSLLLLASPSHCSIHSLAGTAKNYASQRCFSPL